MYIRHLIGPRKGETEDVIFESAKAKILAGEAEDVYRQLSPAPKVVGIAPASPVEASARLASAIASSRPGKKK